VLERLGHFVVRRRWPVLAATIAFVLVSGALGGRVADHLKTGGFDSPSVESQRAADALGAQFHQAPPNFLLLVTSRHRTVDDAAVRRAGVALTNELSGERDVTQVLSHWALGPGSPLESRDHRRAIVVANIAGTDEHAGKIAKTLTSKYTRDSSLITVRVGGFQPVFNEISDTIQKDLSKGESVAIPLTLVLLIVVFGSVVAAATPLAVGIISILGTFLVLRVIASVTNVSVFALSMVTAMGLGLAIDYSLFVVSRFREEMRKGEDTETAIVTTVRTAGRTIVFSGFTVAVCLAALIVFPLYFFKSFGYAGIGVVATAVLGATVFLPALLAVLGPRVDKLTLWRRHPTDVGEGFWHRMAMLVMRRPLPIAIGVVVVLVVLGAPFLRVNLGLPDERVLPPTAKTRVVQDVVRSDFSSEEVESVRVVASGIGDPLDRRAEIASYASFLSRIPGVAHVDSLAGEFERGRLVRGPTIVAGRFAAPSGTWFQVIPSVDPVSKSGEAIVHTIRDARAPFPVLVGGASAQLVDSKAALFSRLPIAIAIIAVATFVLLFMMFGSLLVPVKALVLNFLSLSATFGAMVWIFQWGHLASVLHFTATGQLDISSPILMFCIAFGLSMDYEVFLLSRIKEEYDATADNVRSVAVGLERTGRIVTAAAVLISVVFMSIGLGSIRFMKLFGLGMTIAVLMDAFVIRATLVPAFMRLAGRANWWLPRFLRPLHARVAIQAEVPEAEPAPKAPPVRADAKRPAARKPAARKPSARKPASRKPAAARKKSSARKPAARRKP
jgi:RND superfamily putative drug exporter